MFYSNNGIQALSNKILFNTICLVVSLNICAQHMPCMTQPIGATAKRIITIDFSSSNIYRWTSTEMPVCPGYHIKITATGELKFLGYDNNHPLQDGYTCTPDGMSNRFCAPAPYPALICNSLIAKVTLHGPGGGGDPFQVSSNYDGRAAATGELVLGINSRDWHQYSGIWTIEIQISADKECVSKGDVIMYLGNDGAILHSGVVSELDVDKPCRVKKIDCYDILKNTTMSVDPDDNELIKTYGNNWTVYHSDRNGGQGWLAKNTITITNKGVPLTPSDEINKSKMGVTDAGNYILFKDLGANCHGFTFINGSRLYIAGYKIESDPLVHYSKSNSDQGTAAALILWDNDYRQVSSESIKNPDDHYKARYDVEYLNLPLEYRSW